jgi:hypothetical protein
MSSSRRLLSERSRQARGLEVLGRCRGCQCQLVVVWVRVRVRVVVRVVMRVVH